MFTLYGLILSSCLPLSYQLAKASIAVCGSWCAFSETIVRPQLLFRSTQRKYRVRTNTYNGVFIHGCTLRCIYEQSKPNLHGACAYSIIMRAQSLGSVFVRSHPRIYTRAQNPSSQNDNTNAQKTGRRTYTHLLIHEYLYLINGK